MEATKDIFWLTLFTVSLAVGAGLIAVGKRLGHDFREIGL
jgi:hypothetical protein